MAKAAKAEPQAPDPKTADFLIAMDSRRAYGLLHAALLWAADDAKRPRLQQLHIEGDGKCVALVSTNGHGLWICEEMIEEAPAAAFAFDISLRDARALLRMIDKRRATRAAVRVRRRRSAAPALAPEQVTIERQGGVARVRVGRYTFDVEPTAGEFPPFRRVMSLHQKASDFAGYIGFAGKYMKLAARSLPGSASVYGADSDTVTLHAGGPLDPAIYKGTVDGVPARVLVMPVRV